MTDLYDLQESLEHLIREAGKIRQQLDVSTLAEYDDFEDYKDLKESNDRLKQQCEELQERCHRGAKRWMEVRELVDEFMGWTSSSRAELGEDLGVDSAGGIGAVRLMIKVLKEEK